MRNEQDNRNVSGPETYGSPYGEYNQQPDMQALVQRAKSGDMDAFTTLYELTYSKVFFTVKAMIKDEDAVYDIVQDTYLKAFFHLDQFDGSSRFLLWIKQIAANTSRDWLKKKRPILFSEMNSGAEGEIPFEELLVDERIEHLPEEVIDREETARLVREILEELPEDQRAVIGMYYYEQLSVKQIAWLMETTESAIKSRLLYGRRKIEQKVKELEKKGTRLYSLSPTLFLLLLFRSMDRQPPQQADIRIWNRILERAQGYQAGAGPAAGTSAGKGTASAMRSASAGMEIAIKGIGLARIGLIAASVAVIGGGGIFGLSRARSHTKVQKETAAVVQMSADAAPSETGAAKTTADVMEKAKTEAVTGVKSEDTEKSEAEKTENHETELTVAETVAEFIPETTAEIVKEPETDAYLEIYRDLISKADSLDYDCGTIKPTGVYRYALVNLHEEDTVPALLISQETEDYMQYIRIFLYDAALDQLLQPAESIPMGAGGGFFRGGPSTDEGKTQLQFTSISGGTGKENVYRILVSGDKILYEDLWSGMLGTEPQTLTFRLIDWFDISDRSGIDAVSVTEADTGRPEESSANEAAALPTDGDRLVLTGKVEKLTYQGALDLQGFPDPNKGDKGQTWGYEIHLLGVIEE